MGSIGLATGIATTLINPFTGPVDALVKELVEASAVGSFAWKWVATLGPGALFGLAVGGYLHWRYRASLTRWVLLVVLSVGSWIIAILATLALLRTLRGTRGGEPCRVERSSGAWDWASRSFS